MLLASYVPSFPTTAYIICPSALRSISLQPSEISISETDRSPGPGNRLDSRRKEKLYLLLLEGTYDRSNIEEYH